MIPLPVFVNLYELLLEFKWCSTSLQPYTHVFWAKAATKLVGFPQKRVFALWKMVNLERNQTMISLPVFMNLSYELILKFKWCSTSLQPYTHVFWAKAAT